MATPSGHIVPFVTCFGNHEIDGKTVHRERTRNPFLSQLLGPWTKTSFGCVKIDERAAIWLLDTGCLADHEGAQSAWLTASLADAGAVHFKFACYHEPLYPDFVRRLAITRLKHCRQPLSGKARDDKF